MQIAALIESARRAHLPPLQRKVLGFLQAHPDEVFTSHDETLARELATKPSGISFSLWALHKASIIEKEQVAGKTYFGSREAVSRLRLGIQRPGDNAFERAFANADRIRARLGGNVGSLAILDELRDER